MERCLVLNPNTTAAITDKALTERWPRKRWPTLRGEREAHIIARLLEAPR
jgi:hypothetical protein